VGELEANMTVRLALIVSVTTTLLITACVNLRPSDPVYEGRRLSDWMDDLTNSWSEDEPSAKILARQQMWINVVRGLGTDALPFYVKGIQDTDHAARSYGSDTAFQILGAKAEPAIPDLAGLLAHDKTANAAARGLVAIGPASIPALTNAVATLTSHQRYAAISALGQFGLSAEAAVPTLIHTIKIDPFASDIAMRALVEIDSHHQALIPLFSEHITDSNGAAGAAYALERLGTPGIPVLLQSLTNGPRNIRAFAEGALDPDFQKFSLDKVEASTPAFMRLVTVYNLKALKAASHIYAQGDFRAAAQTAERFLNDTNPAIGLSASNALIYLAPLARTNISQSKIDETKFSDGNVQSFPQSNLPRSDSPN
jgi:hypothetical protein